MEKTFILLGKNIKEQYFYLGKEFVDCCWLIDIIYEILEGEGIEINKGKIYSGKEVIEILNRININIDKLNDLELGEFIYKLL